MAARVTGDTSDDTHLADDSKRQNAPTLQVRRWRMTKGTSVDAHHADDSNRRENAASSSGYAPPVQRVKEDTSVDAHHAGHAFTDTTVALMSSCKAPAATPPAASTVPLCAAKYRDDHTLYVYDRTTFTNPYIPDETEQHEGEAIVLPPDCDPWEALLPFLQRQATNS